MRRKPFVVASGQSVAAPSRRKVEEEFEHTSTYNIGRTQSLHTVHQRVRQELFSPKYIEQHLPINKQLIKGAAELGGSSSGALDLVSLLLCPRRPWCEGIIRTEGEASQVFSASTSHCFHSEVRAQVIFNPSKPQNFHLFSRLAPTPLSSWRNVFCSLVMRTSTSAVQILLSRRCR